jgi:hypothetical protein
MQTFMTTTRGLSTLVLINTDRILYFAVVAAALLAGAWLGSLSIL